jgi:putative oxidoreductase
MGLERLQAPMTLLARVLLAQLFVVEGWSKVINYADTAQYMNGHGVPGKLLPLVIVTELGGGLLIALGLWTRWAATALAGFAGLTALLFHADFSDADQLINFEKNLSIAGGFLVLLVFGPGLWSVDAWLARARPSLSPRASDAPVGGIERGVR